MTDTIPSEFTGFVRSTGVRAFDRLAGRAKELDVPLRNFVRSWSRLSEKDKLALFDELIRAVRSSETEEAQSAQPAKQKRAVKRYDPEEVAATLPKKPAKSSVKAKAKKK